jgi:hypothetical protein
MLEIRTKIEAEAKERQRLAGINTHSNQYMAKKVQVKNNCSEAALEKKQLTTTAEIVADVMGISSGSVKRINQIAKVAPERIENK